MGEVVADGVGCDHLDVVGEPGELGRHDVGRVPPDLEGDPTVVGDVTDGESGAQHAAQDAHDAGIGEHGTSHGVRRSSSVDSTPCHVSARSKPGAAARVDR